MTHEVQIGMPLKRKRLIQIVPHRTSDPDGIGDYAVRLATQLRAQHGLETAFVAGTPAGNEPPADDGWPTVRVSEQSAEGLLTALSRMEETDGNLTVVLHVSGYGYARRGAPFWLLQGLQNWRSHNPRCRLIGIFHELSATSAPWRSAFWFGPFQKQIAAALARMVETAITPCDRYARDLTAWRQPSGNAVIVCPVPSNVGEPQIIPAFDARPPRAAVFGRAGVETAIYAGHSDQLTAAVKFLGITEILDIGARQAPIPARIGSAAIKPLGRLPADDLSAVLQGCRFGFLAYDATKLGKSGVLAAYAAHGAIPVLIGAGKGEVDANLEAGQHILWQPTEVLNPTVGNMMQSAVRRWYDGHALGELARIVAGLIRSEAMDSPRQSPGVGMMDMCKKQ